jgi:hypothetical protein
MKKIKINNLNLILLLSVVLSFGCTKNLEENPKSIISPINFYKNDGDFNAAINGAIRPLFGGYSVFDFNGALLLCSGAEDVTSRQTAPELLMYDIFKPALNGSNAQAMWTQLYKTINACNGIVSNVGKSLVSDANKLLYEGQARYLRALSYFYLTRWFGEVLIITTENQANAKNVAQSPVADIYKVIIEDLTFAENNLPLTFTDKGRPTKGAAKAMLAEVYLTMAGWPLKDATKYSLSRDKAKEVMDLAIYDLEPIFSNLWKVKNKFTNKEFIFMFNGNAANGSANASHLHQGQRPGEEGGWNDLMSEVRFFNEFPAGPRKDESFWTVFADAAKTKWENSSIGKPYMKKWRDAGAGGTAEQGTVSSNDGDGFFPINRYAEVLLTYAEAANMAEGGPSAAALEAVNKVRRRAGGNNQAVYADLPSGMSKEAFDAAVIKEREWELAFEAKRWFDLVRKEQVVSANIAVYPYVLPTHAWQPKPQVEIDIIPGLKQNQGYN